MQITEHNNFNILLVEDNEGDIVLMLEAFEENKIACQVSVVRDGREALDYVFHEGKYKNADTPHLILLDINLPKINGLEVLQKIKQNDATKHIPIVILTTSSSEKDIRAAYRNYVNCYITKPVDVDNFLQTISIIENFWFNLTTLPN